MKNIEIGKSFIVLLVLAVVSPYFIINHYFDKKMQFRSYEECLAIESDFIANWSTKKETLLYCWEQSK